MIKRISAAAFIGALLLSVSAFSQTEYSYRSDVIMYRVAKATSAYDDAIAQLLDACGLKEDAVKATEASKELNSAFTKPVESPAPAVGAPKDPAKEKEQKEKEKKQDDAMKVATKVTNKAVDDLDKVDFNAKADKSKANQCVGQALLSFGAGAIVEGIAVTDAAQLTLDCNNAINQAKSGNPMEGIKLAGSLGHVIKSSQFVSTQVPPQVKKISTISGKLVSYATTNGIKAPTTDEVKAASDSMGKE